MPNKRRGAKRQNDSTRKRMRLQRQIQDERTRLAALTGLSDSELQWLDDHFMNFGLFGHSVRLKALSERAERAYRQENLDPLISYLMILLPEKSRDTQFYKSGKPILDKLRQRVSKRSDVG